MAARYVVRERIFVGFSPELVDTEPVFATKDLSEDECQTLVAAVQQLLDDLHRSVGGGPWNFELVPSAQDDPVAFINLKSKSNAHQRDFDAYRQTTGGSWKSEIVWFYDIAAERADVIRGLRDAQAHVIYLQYDGGHGYDTFDRVDALTLDEIDTLESVLAEELHALGYVVRVVSDWHAEREPQIFVQAKLGWDWGEQQLANDDLNETASMLLNLSSKCVDEILALRKKPLLYSGDGFNDADSGDMTDTVAFPPPKTERLALPLAAAEMPPSEEMCRTYRDPDNYWRNVRLYQQQKANRTQTKRSWMSLCRRLNPEASRHWRLVGRYGWRWSRSRTTTVGRS